jgi:hypothetical protein
LPHAASADIDELPALVMESLGVKLRRKRLRLSLALDELAGHMGLSKPCCLPIETGRLPLSARG